MTDFLKSIHPPLSEQELSKANAYLLPAINKVRECLPLLGAADEMLCVNELGIVLNAAAAVPSLVKEVRASRAAPTPASSVLVGEGAEKQAQIDAARQLRIDADQYALGKGLLPDGSLLFTTAAEGYEAGYSAALAAHPDPLSLLGSGDAPLEDELADLKKELANLYATIFRDGGHRQIELDANTPPETFALDRPRYAEAVRAYWELRKQAESVSAAASTGGGAGQEGKAPPAHREVARDLCYALRDLGLPTTGAIDHEARTLILAAFAKIAAAPQHLVVEGAAAAREKELSDTLFEVRERLLNHSQQEEAHVIAVDLPELINLVIGPAPQQPARFTQEPNLTELPF